MCGWWFDPKAQHNCTSRIPQREEYWDSSQARTLGISKTKKANQEEIHVRWNEQPYWKHCAMLFQLSNCHEHASHGTSENDHKDQTISMHLCIRPDNQHKRYPVVEFLRCIKLRNWSVLPHTEYRKQYRLTTDPTSTPENLESWQRKWDFATML